MEDDEIFIDMLNNVYLPERFTAIWHRDTELLEIIFTADPLPPIWSDLSNRAFEFTHRNVKYLCSFREASDRLRQIATRAMPQRPSRTQYRNLMSFQRHYFAKAGVSGIQIADNSVPYSFYVEGITWNDDLVVELANYLNFYMTY